LFAVSASCSARPWAWRSSRGWAKNFQDYYISLITQQLGARLYSDGIRHSLELPYAVFEDQRSGETLGKLQKVRSDVEKLIAASVNVLFTSLVGIIFVMIYAFSVHWDILRIPTEAKPISPRPLAELRALKFEQVTFQHQSASSPAVTDISFDVHRGETIAFVGPSGAGKTTLVKLLVGLYAPADGHILYNDVASTEIDLDVLRERIGFVTQDTQLFSGSIRENLLFVNPTASDAECLEVMSQAACDSLLARASRGLDTVIGEGGVKVSGGEKQRLSIARALLRRPQLLVFDEATSSLDSLTEEGVVDTIRDVAARGDAITILIAHRLSTILHADRIYVLERGRVVETGRHDGLVEQKGLYYAMWRQQIGERRVGPDPLAARRQTAVLVH
jgi:ABC-type multidrug transport system fused ATPase/permease subunit